MLTSKSQLRLYAQINTALSIQNADSLEDLLSLVKGPFPYWQNITQRAISKCDMFSLAVILKAVPPNGIREWDTLALSTLNLSPRFLTMIMMAANQSSIKVTNWDIVLREILRRCTEDYLKVFLKYASPGNKESWHEFAQTAALRSENFLKILLEAAPPGTFTE